MSNILDAHYPQKSPICIDKRAPNTLNMSYIPHAPHPMCISSKRQIFYTRIIHNISRYAFLYTSTKEPYIHPQKSRIHVYIWCHVFCTHLIHSSSWAPLYIHLQKSPICICKRALYTSAKQPYTCTYTSPHYVMDPVVYIRHVCVRDGHVIQFVTTHINHWQKTDLMHLQHDIGLLFISVFSVGLFCERSLSQMHSRKNPTYGVALVSRMNDHSYRALLRKRPIIHAKEAYHSRDPTNQSHPIRRILSWVHIGQFVTTHINQWRKTFLMHLQHSPRCIHEWGMGMSFSSWRLI